MTWWRPRLGPTLVFLVLLPIIIHEARTGSDWAMIHAIMAGLCVPLIANDWSEWWVDVSWRLWGERRWRREHPGAPEPAGIRDEQVYQMLRALRNAQIEATEMEIRSRYLK